MQQDTPDSIWRSVSAFSPSVGRRWLLHSVATGAAVVLGGCSELTRFGNETPEAAIEPSDSECGPGETIVREVATNRDQYVNQVLTVVGVVIAIEPEGPAIGVHDGTGYATALDVGVISEDEARELAYSCVSVTGTLPSDASRYSVPTVTAEESDPGIVLLDASWELR